MNTIRPFALKPNEHQTQRSREEYKLVLKSGQLAREQSGGVNLKIEHLSLATQAGFTNSISSRVYLSTINNIIENRHW